MPARDYDPSGKLLRDVDFRISGQFITGWADVAFGVLGALWNAYSDERSTIQNLLNARGWLVEQVADESGWTGNWVFRITAVIGTNFSDGQIQAQVARDLAGVFTVTGFTMISAPWSGIYNAGDLGTVTVHTGDQQTGVNYQQMGGASSGNNAAGSSHGWDEFWKAAGFLTPPSLATVGVAGLIVLVLLTRK